MHIPPRSPQDAPDFLQGVGPLLDVTPVPFLLVEAFLGDVRSVWANRSFYQFTGLKQPVNGLTLRECKITLHRNNPITSAIERWNPLTTHKSPTDGRRIAQTHEDPASFLASASLSEAEESYEVWTCDIETGSGNWVMAQALTSPVPEHFDLTASLNSSPQGIEDEEGRDRAEPAQHEPAPARTLWSIQILPDHSRSQTMLESHAVTALEALSEISTLLTDVAHPQVLRSIAEILVESTPAIWAGFLLGRDELEYAEGITAENSRRPARRSNFLATEDLPAPNGYSLLVDATDAFMVFDLHRKYPTKSVENTLQQRLQHIWQGERLPESALVTARAIEGRDLRYGLLVCVYPESNDLGEAFGIPDIPPESRKVFTTVARRVGMAIENVQLYEREHELAQTLQRSMLPTQDDIEDLDIWTYYAPSSDHARVGGDWFDVSYVREQAVGVVVGDVVGHDIEAAAAMGQLRLITRSYGFECESAANVLERVDDLIEGLEVSHQASLVYGRFIRQAVGPYPWELEYIRAGHLPPLVLREGRVIMLNKANGSLIGFRKRQRVSETFDLLPGDIVIMYTDGLIERRDRPLQMGLVDLSEALSAGPATSAAEVGDRVLSRVLDAPEDDVAIVLIRIPEAAEQPDSEQLIRRVKVTLPQEAASVGRARKIVAETCAEWGVPSDSAVLVVSELVSNAVLHAGGPMILRVRDTERSVRIEVEDQSPVGPRKLDGHPSGDGGYGVKIVSTLAQWGWEPRGAGKIVWAEVAY